MPKLTLQTLGRMLVDKRGSKALRQVAKEASISYATLSRIERGYPPDLETFKKLCAYLRVDPGEVLGLKGGMAGTPIATVHFRKDRTLKPKTAEALAQLILAAQRAALASENQGERS